MTRRGLAILLLLVFPSCLWAQRGQSAGAPRIRGSAWSPVLQLGLDMRFERDEDQTTKMRSIPGFAVGLLHDHWLGEFEYASFSQSTGNSSLAVKRQSDTALLWLYWQALDGQTIAPYLGGAIGALHDTVETSLYDDSERDQSPWNFMTAGALGLRLFPKSIFWLSIEGRLYKSARLDPDPQLGTVARVGFVF